MKQFSEVRELAEEALGYFETLKNNPEDMLTYRKKDDAPEWVNNMVYEAHNSGEYLPDDYRFRWLVDTLEAIAETDNEDDATERINEIEPFAYYKDLTHWLDSNILRVHYLDDVVETYGAVKNVLAYAMKIEIEEVGFTVLGYLQNLDS